MVTFDCQSIQQDLCFRMAYLLTISSMNPMTYVLQINPWNHELIQIIKNHSNRPEISSANNLNFYKKNLISREMELIIQVIIAATVIIFAFMGLVIVYLNLTIAHIFMEKPKKLPSDFLVTAGLLGDAVYGFMLLSIPFVFLISYFFYSVLQIRFLYDLIFYLFLDSALTLFSLFMIFIMTINRYFAVVRPFRYKHFFSLSKVRVMLITVTVICSVLFISSFLLKYFSSIAWHNESSQLAAVSQTILDQFPNFWPEIQLVFVAIDSVLLVYVYISVAQAYD